MIVMATQTHVRDSIRQVDDHNWLVGSRLLITSSSTASPDCLWNGNDGSFYSVSKVHGTPPASQPFTRTSSSPFELVYDAGDAHVAWRIGDAFLKVNIATFPSTTREHVTLAAVNAMSPSFAIPNVLFHGEWDGRYYLIVSALPGQTLGTMWSSMDEGTKCHYVDRIVDICIELASQQANYIGGVDHGLLSDLYLATSDKEPDLSHGALLKACMDLEMDCSTFVFFHCDLGPGNLIIAPDGSLGIIDWETAGFVPRDWMRTKFRVSSGLDLPDDAAEDTGEWRMRVQIRLGEKGYPELANEYMTLRGYA